MHIDIDAEPDEISRRLKMVNGHMDSEIIILQDIKK